MKRRGRGEGGVTFLKSRSVYVASVFVGFDAKGKPLYRKVQRKLKSEATAALKELRAELDSGKPKIDRQKSVGGWMREWLMDHVKPNLAPKTYRFYEQMFRLHINPALGSTSLSKLDPATVAKFLHTKRTEFESSGAGGPATLDAIRRTLRAALKKAVALGYLAYCPVNEATQVSKGKAPERKFLTPTESQALFKALEGSPIEHLVRFVMRTGVRVGEATGLRWSDVDLKTSSVRIAVQLQRVDGALTLRELKTEKSNRVIPVAGYSLDAIQKSKQVQEEFGFPNPMGLVFLNPEGRPFDPKYVDSKLKAVLKRAGLPPMGMHALRHSAATSMLQNGAPAAVVSRILGHSTITLTTNTYGHVLQDAQDKALRLLDDFSADLDTD